jgi:hypothetical protein
MKKEINIKDPVWIHIGERKLTKGRVVEIIDLTHLEEGHSKDTELYIIEIKTGIEDIYEVRTLQQISLDPKGPINLFKSTQTQHEQRYLNKVGMIMPNEEGVIPADDYVEEDFLVTDEAEPTPDQIHAALERSQQAVQHEPLAATKKPKPKYVKHRPKKV